MKLGHEFSMPSYGQELIQILHYRKKHDSSRLFIEW